MSSIVKVDTIQENTSANGITVDGLNIKDSKLVTADSVVTSNITNDAVTIDKLNLISTSSAPSLEAKGDGSSQDGYIQLNCSQNSHGIKLKSPPHSAGQSYTLTFPQSISADTFLKTDGSGNLSFAAAGGGLASQQVFTSSGTWTKPSGINLVKVYVTAGGGGGGWSGGTNYYSGGGGGAGGTAIEIIDVSSVSSVSVTVASAAVGGTQQDYPGHGGTSSFGSYCSASGGTRGNYGGGIAGQATGGVGSNGDVNLTGSAGQGGSDNAGSFKETSGNGGSSFWGGAGSGDHSANGHAGAHGGGGGGGQNFNGGSNGQNGGAGGAGIVVVEEYK